MSQPQNAQLPSMPGVVLKLLNMFSDPDVSIDEVVETLKTDAALAGRILKAANSSTIAASQKIGDVKRATMLLGKKTVSTLALSFSLADRSMGADCYGDMFRAYWNQSIVTGVAASILAQKYSKLKADEAFLVGLLSRIGRLGALTFAPEQFGACTEISARSGCSVDAMLISNLGSTCEELTLQYMEAWMLPPSFISLVEGMQQAAKRDRMQESTESAGDPAELDASGVLRVASAIGQFCSGENTGLALATIHELMNPIFAGSDEELDKLIEEVLEQYSVYCEMLKFDTSSVGTPAELHARAMAHLIEIAMSPDRREAPANQNTASEVDWLKQRVNDLTHRLTLDSMTTIHNRSYFDLQLENQIAVARLVKQFVAVLFVDVNEFKQVNDKYGHDVGDEVLRAIARSLKDLIRNEDIVARYGGDEFVILCEMNNIDGLHAQAERVTAAIEGLTVPCHGVLHEVSLAIGGAIGTPDGSSDFGERLIRASDEAMYEAKQRRHNPVIRKIDKEPSAHVMAAVPEESLSV